MLKICVLTAVVLGLVVHGALSINAQAVKPTPAQDPKRVEAIKHSGVAWDSYASARSTTDQQAVAQSFKKAIDEATIAIKIDPTFPNAYSVRALAYLDMPVEAKDVRPNQNKALADLSSYIELEPNTAAHRTMRGDLRLMIAESDMSLDAGLDAFMSRLDAKDKAAQGVKPGAGSDQIDMAIADYTKALSIIPNLRDPLFGRAKAYRLKGDFIRARADLTAVLKIKPEDAAALSELAKLPAAAAPQPVIDKAASLKHQTAAAAMMTEAFKTTSADARNSLCNKIVAELTQAIAAEPANALSYLGRGIAYSLFMVSTDDERNAYRAKAVADLDNAISLDPNAAAAYSTRGSIRLDSAEHTKKASKFLIDAGQMKGDPLTTGVDSFGKTAAQSLDLAIKDLSKAISLTPDTAYPWFLRGKAFRIKEDYGKARADLTTALRLEPNDKTVQDELNLLPAAADAGISRTALDKVVGDWDATNVAGGSTIKFHLRFLNKNGRLAGELVNDNGGPPLEFKDFVTDSDGTFSFKIYPPNASVFTCKGSFIGGYTALTATSSITAGTQTFTGVFEGKKR